VDKGDAHTTLLAQEDQSTNSYQSQING